MTSLIPKISFAVFHLFAASEVCEIHNFIQFCVTSTVFDENKVKYRTKSSRWNNYFLSIFKIRVCHFLMGDMGEGGSRQKITNCDKGEGVKNSDFRSDVFFEWPLYYNKMYCSNSRFLPYTISDRPNFFLGNAAHLYNIPILSGSI